MEEQLSLEFLRVVENGAIAAARQWRTTTPRAQGKPVKTIFAVDVPFTP